MMYDPKVLKKVGLSVHSDAHKLRIKSKFNLWNRGNAGMVFIGILSLILLIFNLWFVKDNIVKVVFSIFMFGLLVFSILGILKQLFDYVEITNHKIKFSNSLKKRKHTLRPSFKIKVKSSIERVKRRGRPASYFCLVELFLKTSFGKFRILDFQSDRKYEDELKKLGNELKHMIEERFPSV